MSHYDVVVVGLGAMGSAALYHLARTGRRVIGFEQASPGHEGGSSHGESRLIRLAQFENPDYTPLVRRAWDLWQALERESGEQVLAETGLLEAGLPGAPWLEGSLRASREHCLAHEVMSGAEANRRFPAFNLPPDFVAAHQRDAGLLRADVAIRLFVAGARAAGAEVALGVRVAGVTPKHEAVQVSLADGQAIIANAAVITTGPWIAELVPELASHLTLTRQVLTWFEPARPAETAPGRMPAFGIETKDDAVYGFPDFAGLGVKASSHRHGRVLAHARDARQDGDEADARPIAEALARLVPSAAGPLRALKTCIYTSTPDEEFVIDRVPGHPQVVFASACSGHGFKFASVFGEMLADMATSEAMPPALAAFSLSRFTPASANQAR
jgi:sarcosine oxidase